jgi:plasmid stabilization system protein ParE
MSRKNVGGPFCLTPEADFDLLRFFDFLLEKDIEAALRALDAIKEAFRVLERFPFTRRMSRSISVKASPPCLTGA